MSNREKSRSALPGALMLVVWLAVLGLSIWLFARGAGAGEVAVILSGVALFVVFVVGLLGFVVVPPNYSVVLVLFGKYTGSIKNNGFWWVNPFTSRRKLSLRARNFDGEKLKVNDLEGNPIEIAAVIVWRVSNTFAAVFDVDDFSKFVSIQADSALRHLAKLYPYDNSEAQNEISLRGSADEVSEALRHELQERVSRAGVVIDEARLSHLAYAPEIASAMLQRQQAAAIIAARTRIVEGAVSMVEMALAQLGERNIVELDEEKKATMVSNLLVVLTGERAVAPIVNAGSIY